MNPPRRRTRGLPILMPAIFPPGWSTGGGGRYSTHVEIEISKLLRSMFPFPDDRRRILQYVNLTEVEAPLDPNEEWPTLVRRCSEALYGVEDLLTEIYGSAGLPRRMRQVLEIVETVTGRPAVSPSQFDGLAQIVVGSQLSARTMRMVVSQAGLASTRTLDADVDQPYDVLRELVFLAGDRAGFLGYVDRLARQPGAQPVARDLLDWVKDAGGEPLPPPGVADQLGRAQPAAGPQPYLLVRVDPVGGDHYTVRAWLHRHGVGDRPLVDTDETATRQELVALLDGVVRQVEHDMGETERLAIELFLPRNLLSLDVDEWRLGYSGQEGADVAVGAQYTVMVRSLERATQLPRPFRGAWRRKWVHSAACEGQGDCHLTFWDAPKPDVNYYALWFDDVRPAAVALGFQPDRAGVGGHAFHAALQAGVPVAFWNRREGADKAPFEQLVSSLFDGGPLAQLPERVRVHRREAAATPTEQAPARGLVVLFDDPDRIPPSLGGRFAPPPGSDGQL